MRVFKRVAAAFHSVTVLIQFGGGLRPTLVRIYEVLRSEGLDGLRRGLRHADRFQHSGMDDHRLRERQRKAYQEWIRRYDSLNSAQRQNMVDEVGHWKMKPCVSVLIFTVNPDLNVLRSTIDSVISQIYPHWELCIVDDPSGDRDSKQRLMAMSELDARIKVIPHAHRGLLDDAAQIALENTSGEWIGFLGPEDLLAPHALWFVVEATVKNPQARVLYSDEDRIGQDGIREEPRFKPAWNPELARSSPYMGQWVVFGSALIKALGGCTESCPGAEAYDLFLRCTESVTAEQIAHVPRVLYHARSSDKGPESINAAMPTVLKAGQRAIQGHLDRKHCKATVFAVEGGYRVRYALPANLPKVSIIIPTRDAAELVRGCIESIAAVSTYPNYEIVLVDNGSSDPAALSYFDGLREKGVLVIQDDGPFNYSALNNLAVKQATGEVICLLNNDILALTPDWLEEMVSHVLRDEIGVVGAKLLFPDNTIQHAGVILGVAGVAGHAFYRMSSVGGGYLGRKHLTSNYSAVTAACMVVRKSVYTEVKGLDEVSFPVGFNDIDFCLRIQQAGYRNVYTPHAVMYHLESKTRGLDITPEKKARLQRESMLMTARWGELLMQDPAYNPNLSLEWGDFSLAFPPRIQPLSSDRR